DRDPANDVRAIVPRQQRAVGLRDDAQAVPRRRLQRGAVMSQDLFVGKQLLAEDGERECCAVEGVLPQNILLLQAGGHEASLLIEHSPITRYRTLDGCLLHGQSKFSRRKQGAAVKPLIAGRGVIILDWDQVYEGL